MSTIRITLTVLILSGIFYNGQASEWFSNQKSNKQNPASVQLAQKDSTTKKRGINFRLHANSVINQKAPEFVVEEWLSEKPDLKGKFVLIDFWSTTCGPCKQMIPMLNEWNKKFKKDLVIVGVSHEKAEKVKAMKGHDMEYYNAIDTQKRMHDKLGVYAIPHVILVDPQGIVRWEGYPLGVEKLTDEVIEKIITTYGKKN